MATTRQRNAARRNIKKAAAGAKRKKTRTALGKQANKVKREKARARRR